MQNKVLVIGQCQFRFNWMVSAAVLSVLAGLVRLGMWQLERAGEKIELQDNFRAMQTRTAVSVENVDTSGLEKDAIVLQNRQVVLKGHYLNERSIYLIYKTYEEQIGYEIVTPFQLSVRDEVVMVSRGWTGAASYEDLNKRLPKIAGPQELRGQIYVPRAAEAERRNGRSVMEGPGWPLLLRHLNFEELRPLFSQALFPYVVRLNEGQNGVLVRYWPEVQVNTGRHFSYALQWFAMAIALAVTSLILSSNLLSLFGAGSRSAVDEPT